MILYTYDSSTEMPHVAEFLKGAFAYDTVWGKIQGDGRKFSLDLTEFGCPEVTLSSSQNVKKHFGTNRSEYYDAILKVFTTAKSSC